MRALIQRVTHAQVTVAGDVVGKLSGPGLVVLVGVTQSDTAEDAAWIARKIADLRIMADELSVRDLAAPVLVVSQFTLYANVQKGRRPSWNQAARGDIAEPMVGAVVSALEAQGVHVEQGVFGADMQVSLVNDGPMTIWLDTADV